MQVRTQFKYGPKQVEAITAALRRVKSNCNTSWAIHRFESAIRSYLLNTEYGEETNVIVHAASVSLQANALCENLLSTPRGQ